MHPAMKSETSTSDGVSAHRTKSRKQLSSFGPGDIKAESKLEISFAPSDMKRESKRESSSKFFADMETLSDPLLQTRYPKFPLCVEADMLDRTAFSDNHKCEHVVTEEQEELAEDADKEMEGEEDEDFDDGDTDFSFEFSCSMSLDLPPELNIISAEELFFNGKLRPLQAESSIFYQNPEEMHQTEKKLPASVRNKEAMERSSNAKETNVNRRLREDYKHGKNAADLQRNLPMVKTNLHTSLAMAKEHLKSLQESPRCLSMTIEGSRGRPRRSCVSLTNSRCSSPSRSRASGTFSQPPTTPTSPKAQSSQKNKTFLHFFKLKRHLTSNKDAFFPFSESNSASSSRLSRAFWPFSRSNSAGESKSSHGVSPLPRRSNSAGESKTTSSALLPNISSKYDGESKGKSATAPSVLSARKPHVGHPNHQHAEYKKSLPPLIPSANSKKASSCFVVTNCGSDSVAPLQPVGEAALCIPTPTSRSSSSCTPAPSLPFSLTSGKVPHVSRTQSSPLQSGEGDTSTHTQSSSSMFLPEFKASASPGRHMRHASATNPVRNSTRGSPSRQWSNPSIGGSTRGSLQRFGPTPAPPRCLNMRPKDALSRETVSVRVAPVLNVPACMTPSSKSKLFNLGNLFSKKEKAARGYTMLVSTDSQSGG